MAPQIHPTAQVAPDAQLAEDVQVGAFAVIDGPAVVGRGTILRPFAHLSGRVTLGQRNDVGSGCVLGDRPQHKAYNGEDTGIVVGDDNVFREHVTIHRGMPNAQGMTRIGNGNLFMVSSHVAHDCTLGDNCTLANGALVAGHCNLADGVFISGNSVVHQNCALGRLALISGISGTSQDVPPFWVIRGHNGAAGVNVLGMRRAGIATAEIQAVRKAFKIIYQGDLTMSLAVEQVTKQFAHIRAVQEVAEFIAGSKRGVAGAHRFHSDLDAAAA